MQELVQELGKRLGELETENIYLKLVIRDLEARLEASQTPEEAPVEE